LNLKLAELTGEKHDRVMRDIRNVNSDYLLVYGGERIFALSFYITDQNKKMPEYKLTKSQTLFSISRYDLVIAAKIQKRWEELKNKA